MEIKLHAKLTIMKFNFCIHRANLLIPLVENGTSFVENLAVQANIGQIDFRVAEKSSWCLKVVYRFETEAKIDIHLFDFG